MKMQSKIARIDEAKGGRKANAERTKKEADLKKGGRKANIKEGHRRAK